MLTRLRVTGFKNLKDVDVRFGPFTCIAGGNAVGKSNLFDAIMFLSALADTPVMESAMSVRDKSGRSTDIRTLFHATSGGHARRMSFDVEMIIPQGGVDDLGQRAEASTTFLEYSLAIELREGDHGRPSLQVAEERLDYVTMREARKRLLFKSSSKWQKTVLRGKKTSPFISTTETPNGTMVRLHQDSRAGRARMFLASSLPRTVLSTVNAVESPTAVLARREMQSWRLLQLEPSALRASDSFTDPSTIGSDGSHLASALYYLSRQAENDRSGDFPPNVLASVSSRLADLVDDVRGIEIEKDDRRELLTLMVKTKDGTIHPARSLSDGTLRFLALAAIEADPQSTGVICLEEPENGIHPERVVAILELLRDMAVDTSEAVGPANPLRQVIVNTHSPAVVAQVDPDSLLFADKVDQDTGGQRSSSVVFLPLSQTWRARAEPDGKTVQKATVLQFLSPVRDDASDHERSRVVDRHEFRQLPMFAAEELAPVE